ncbi:hypothetical protein Tco_0438577 [Tanacetum coccineum]
MLPSDSLDVELMDTANAVVKEELQDPNITKGTFYWNQLPYSNTFVDEMLPSNAFEEISAVSANEDAVEELQDINITEGTLTDKLPPPDIHDVKLTNDAIEGVEEMLQDISFNESALIDEFAPSNPLGVELTSDEQHPQPYSG